jgi:hypothetical protein
MKKNEKRISERGFERRLANLLTRVLERSGGHVTTFAGAGVLTMNKGLVVTLGGRQEFQLTIVENTRGR